jgi:hypothetical protein
VDGEAPARTWVTVATLRSGQADMTEQCKLEKEFYARQPDDEDDEAPPKRKPKAKAKPKKKKR